MDDPLIVKQSLKGNVLYAIGALVMSLLSLLFAFVVKRSSFELTQNIIVYSLLKVILVFGFFFFGYCLLFLLKRVKSKKHLLIVDDKGITDNSTALAFGFIPWTDIDKIYMGSFMGSQFIEIALNKEEHYLLKLSGIKKQLVLLNKKLGHQLVGITLNSSGVSQAVLLPKIIEKFEQSKLS